MVVYPGDPPPQFTRLRDHARGDEWTTTHLALSAHTGTHVDAPAHRIRGGATVDQISLQVLTGPAYVVDCTDVRDELEAEHLEARGIPVDAVRLLFKTRNSALWERPGFVSDYVALGGSGAQWVRERGVQLVGFDYLSADRFDAADMPAHTRLLAAGVVILEGLMLAPVPPGAYQLVCLPLKLVGTDGAPARAVLIRS
jgi:arylformamidase